MRSSVVTSRCSWVAESGTALTTWATDWPRRRAAPGRGPPRADHGGHRRAARAGRRGGQPLDLVLRTVHVRAGQRVPDQPLGDRADLPGQQPVQQRGLALTRRGAVPEDPGEVVVAGDDPAEPEQL